MIILIISGCGSHPKPAAETEYPEEIYDEVAEAEELQDDEQAVDEVTMDDDPSTPAMCQTLNSLIDHYPLYDDLKGLQLFREGVALYHEALLNTSFFKRAYIVDFGTPEFDAVVDSLGSKEEAMQVYSQTLRTMGMCDALKGYAASKSETSLGSFWFLHTLFEKSGQPSFKLTVSREGTPVEHYVVTLETERTH